MKPFPPLRPVPYGELYYMPIHIDGRGWGIGPDGNDDGGGYGDGTGGGNGCEGGHYTYDLNRVQHLRLSNTLAMLCWLLEE